jgi:hypothetical protein
VGDRKTAFFRRPSDVLFRLAIFIGDGLGFGQGFFLAFDHASRSILLRQGVRAALFVGRNE